ncbi:MAG: YoaK family protein [Carbonactinosporaceae bacterium]
MNRRQVRDLLLLMLTAVAGCVDAISFLGLGQVFTANMTGNVVLLGLAAGRGATTQALRAGVALAGFALGALVGARLAGGGAPRRDPGPSLWPARVTLSLGVELLLLASFATGWRLTADQPGVLAPYALTALLSVAMGLQSAAARRLGVTGVATTYVTGTLTALMAGLAGAGRARGSWARRAAVLAAVLAALGFGAAAGGALLHWQPQAAPMVPVALLVAVIAIAAISFLPTGKR